MVNFSFRLPFTRPSHTEVADLRDRCIVAETRALLLEDIVMHRGVAPRERRKDAKDVIAAKRAKTKQLQDELGWNGL